MKYIKNWLKKNYKVDYAAHGIDVTFFVLLGILLWLPTLILPKTPSQAWVQARLLWIVLGLVVLYLAAVSLYAFFSFIQLQRFGRVRQFLPFLIVTLCVVSVALFLLLLSSLIFLFPLPVIGTIGKIFFFAVLLFTPLLLQFYHFEYLKRSSDAFGRTLKKVGTKKFFFPLLPLVAGGLVTALVATLFQKIFITLVGYDVSPFIYYLDVILFDAIIVVGIFLLLQLFRSIVYQTVCK